MLSSLFLAPRWKDGIQWDWLLHLRKFEIATRLSGAGGLKLPAKMFHSRFYTRKQGPKQGLFGTKYRQIAKRET